MVVFTVHRPRRLWRSRSRGSTLVRAGAWVGLCCAFFDGTALRAQPRPSEYDVKAAYLLNFGKFVRFSSSASQAQQSTFDICILGEDPMVASLDAITVNERINERPVRVVRLKEPGVARGCAIEYISASEAAHLERDLNQIGDGDVLTVSDAPRFLALGGMVQFVPVANHVRFAINLTAVKRTHLVVSSELLRVAVSISGMPATEAVP